MITLEVAGKYSRNRSYYQKYIDTIPKAFFEDGKEGSSSYIVFMENVPCGIVSQFTAGEKKLMTNFFFDPSLKFSGKIRVIHYFCERAVKICRSEKVLCAYALNDDGRALKACLFYPKGKMKMRVADPDRLLLPNACFDEEGMIINQGLTESIPFGWFDSKRKGCGWIAAYNLLRMNGRDMEIHDVVKGLEKTAFLGQVLGQNELSLMMWLALQGLDVHRTIPSDQITINKIRESRNGILLYSHRGGSHYAAYRVCADGRILLYNAVYGKVNHLADPGEFLKKYGLFPVSSLIYVK